MSEYTPTTEQVRDLYEFGARKAGESAHTVGADVDVAETLAMFARWLDAHDREAKAEAREEALREASGVAAVVARARGTAYQVADAVYDLRDHE